MSRADEIRAFAYQHYIQPACQKGDRFVTIRAGDVHSEMPLCPQGPEICGAMGANKFLSEYNLKLVSREGPTNGFNVLFTYEILYGK